MIKSSIVDCKRCSFVVSRVVSWHWMTFLCSFVSIDSAVPWKRRKIRGLNVFVAAVFSLHF